MKGRRKVKGEVKKAEPQTELHTEDETRKTEEQEEGEEKKDEEKKDVKLGEIKLREDSVLVIKKTSWKGHDRVDFRVWKNSATYKGPTKQGFVVTMEKVDEFIKIVEGMKKKLKD